MRVGTGDELRVQRAVTAARGVSPSVTVWVYLQWGGRSGWADAWRGA